MCNTVVYQKVGTASASCSRPYHQSIVSLYYFYHYLSSHSQTILIKETFYEFLGLGKSNLTCLSFLSRYRTAEKGFPALDLKPLMKEVRPFVKRADICEIVSFFLQISECIWKLQF